MTARAARQQAGFTLVEVMIALGILALGLTVLLRSASGNLAATRRAHMGSVAAELARGKMYDLEEQLLEDGFQQLDQELHGDFEEEGWEKIEWEAKIVKIELPNLEALGQMGAADVAGSEGAASSPLLGMLAFLPGGAGAGDMSAADASSAAGAGVLTSQYELLRNLFEESIRKITLKVKYTVGADDRDFTLDLYVTDPSAIGRQMGGLAAGGQAPGGDESGKDSGSGTGSGSGSGRGQSRGSGRGRVQ